VAQEESDPDRLRLLDAMSTRTRLTVAEITRRSGLVPDRVRALLGLLHLDGAVDLDETGWRRVSRPRNT